MEPKLPKSTIPETVGCSARNLLSPPDFHSQALHSNTPKSVSRYLSFIGDMYECCTILLSCSWVFQPFKRITIRSTTGIKFLVLTISLLLKDFFCRSLLLLLPWFFFWIYGAVRGQGLSHILVGRWKTFNDVWRYSRHLKEGERRSTSFFLAFNSLSILQVGFCRSNRVSMSLSYHSHHLIVIR